MSERGGWWLVARLWAVLLATLALVLSLAPETRSWAVAEGGPFEAASVVLYGVAALLMGLRQRMDGASRAACALLLLACAARELDLDKSGFTSGLLKARQYTSPLVPGEEKLIGLLVLAVLLAAIGILVWRHGRGLVRRLFAGSPAAWSFGFGAGLLVFSKAIDGLARKLEPFGIAVSRGVADQAVVLEEVCEMWAPLFWIVAIVVAVRSSRAAEKRIA